MTLLTLGQIQIQIQLLHYCTVCCTLYTALYTSHCTAHYTLHCTLHTALHTSHCTAHYTLQCTRGCGFIEKIVMGKAFPSFQHYAILAVTEKNIFSSCFLQHEFEGQSSWNCSAQNSASWTLHSSLSLLSSLCTLHCARCTLKSPLRSALPFFNLNAALILSLTFYSTLHSSICILYS